VSSLFSSTLLPPFQAHVPVPPPQLRVLHRVTGTLAAVLDAGARARAESSPSEGARFRAQASQTHRLAKRLAELNGLRLRVEGPLPGAPCLLVANHLGYWDAVFLGALLPLVAIAKSELSGWPALGKCGQALGTLYVRRGDVHHGARVLRQGLRRLCAGVHLLNFPEGTTTDGSQVLPFRRGAFGMASRAGVGVVPVALRLVPAEACWLGGEAFLPHYRRHWQRGGVVEATVRFGRPLQPRDFGTAEACAEAARAEVLALLGRKAA
jgi:1-acyl-sn-glycerol-3-phosphate acyltransferase